MDSDLKHLMAIPAKQLSAPMKLAFQMLWLAAGSEPRERMSVDKRWLAQSLGATDARSAMGWLDGLAVRGLVWIHERDAGAFVVVISIYRPTASLYGETAADDQGQQSLPFPDAGTCAREPAQGPARNSPREISIHTRTRAVEDEVEDEDDVDTGEDLDSISPRGEPTAAPRGGEIVDVTDEQLECAIDGLASLITRFTRHRIGLPRPSAREEEDDHPHEENFSLILRAHIAVQTSRLTRDWWAGGVEYVLNERIRKRVGNCFALLWTDWRKQRPECGSIVARIRLPPDWYERTRSAFRQSAGVT